MAKSDLPEIKERAAQVYRLLFVALMDYQRDFGNGDPNTAERLALNVDHALTHVDILLDRLGIDPYSINLMIDDD